MTNPDYTAILIIADRSGSMWSISKDMEGGITSFLQEQEKVEGKATVDLIYFDNEFTYNEKMLSLTAAVPSIHPRGGTALYDAIVRGSNEFGQSLADLPEEERPGKVIVIIVTDGHENQSRESTIEDVKKVIETQQNDYSWEYVFLGANQDAVLTGTSFGIKRGSNLTYTASSAGIAVASAGLTNYVTQVRSGNFASFEKTEDKDSNVV